MSLPEYEAVSRAPSELSSLGPGQTRTNPLALGQEVEGLRSVAAEAEKRLAANARRIAELEALCQARHTGLQIVLAQLHAAEQRAVEAERALSESAIPRFSGRRRARAAAR